MLARAWRENQVSEDVLKPILMPGRYNYAAAFLTFACNLRCSYCINYYEQSVIQRPMLSGQEWVRGLNRIQSRPDLPLTMQGGEPSLHPDFIFIINHLKPELPIDILTNLQFDVDQFVKAVDPQRVNRSAPYASIRVSYHPETMDLQELIKKTLYMQDAGFSIGIWAVLHPAQEDQARRAQEICSKRGIDFRFKEFLGEHKGQLYGQYKLEGACSKVFKKNVLCRTTELLMDSAGYIYRCHADLYAGVHPVGHILDPAYQIDESFRECDYFGHCNPCDVKVKTNRFQEFGHTSVEIKLNE